MKNNFEIRKANIKDLKHILKLNHELFKEVTKKNGFAEIVENDGKIIGYFCGGISERLFYRKKAKYARLDNMLIDKKFRGKNLGTKLVKNFMEWCKKNKVDYISVDVSSGNEKSVNFYKKKWVCRNR
jgi:GNAT superfamily N-acetyltransferase